jgi:hypothetical protein
LEVPHVHANIQLERLRLKPAMTMSMQVDRALAHVPPGSERIVADFANTLTIRPVAIRAIPSGDTPQTTTMPWTILIVKRS